MVKNAPANAGDSGLIPGSGRCPGEGNGTPLQYSCWKTPWTEESSSLQAMGSQRVRDDLVTEQQAIRKQGSMPKEKEKKDVNR